MVKFLVSTAAYLVANAAGLLAAVLLLPGFQIDFLAFMTAVLIFSAFQTLAGPLITKLSLKKMPQLIGGIALVTIFFGLLVTDVLMARMEMGGIANWLAATLLVWIGSLIATILLPIYVFKQLRDKKQHDRMEMEQDVDRAVAAAERAAASAAAAARAAATPRAPVEEGTAADPARPHTAAPADSSGRPREG